MERIKEIEKEAILFHTSTNFDFAKNREILSEMDRIETKVTRIPHFNQDDLVSTLIAYRQSITSNNFDKSGFKSQEHEGDLIRNICEQSLDFDEALESQYSVAYPIKFKLLYLFSR